MNLINILEETELLIIAISRGNIDFNEIKNKYVRCVEVGVEEVLYGNIDTDLIYIAGSRPADALISAPMLYYGSKYIFFLKRSEQYQEISQYIPDSTDKMYEIVDINRVLMIESKYPLEDMNVEFESLTQVHPLEQPASVVDVIKTACRFAKADDKTKDSILKEIKSRKESLFLWLAKQIEHENPAEKE